MSDVIRMTKDSPTKKGRYLHSRDGKNLEVVNIDESMSFLSGSDCYGIPNFCNATNVGGWWLCLDDVSIELE